MPARVAQWKVGEDEARDTAMLDDVFRRAYDHGRNAAPLKISGYQTHGLVADWSKGREHGGMDLVIA